MKKALLFVSLGLHFLNGYSQLSISESLIPAGIYNMGDHFGFVDPNHPSDEIPLHTVKVDSFYMATFETTNQQFLDFLDSAISSNIISVQNNKVYSLGDTNILCFTKQYQPWYSISYNGSAFSMADFRANHPMVGVMWCGAAVYCNWLSLQNGLQACYNLQNWDCDFTKNGYRLPTEAEWEWAARGGHVNPYFNYPNGDSIIVNQANLPSGNDPYENGIYPYTTPVGFYDGTLKLKSTYNWPAGVSTYQTSNGVNGFGLYDVQGNVWEFVNDWYEQNYYSLSPFSNPTGPISGSLMPDGKPYRGMRGGNWYNGMIDSLGVNNGHSRVSNRNPSYYRGPLDPNHPWYHIGFRVARNYTYPTSNHLISPQGFHLQLYPNPTRENLSLSFTLKKETHLRSELYNAIGEKMADVLNDKLGAGLHQVNWKAGQYTNGIYTIKITSNSNQEIKKIILMK